MNNISKRTVKMVLLAILAAIMIILAFTPLGYLRIGVIQASFLMVPIAIGAIILGPAAGAFLGGVFGTTSFIQCFGLDVFGTTLLGINPVFTFILCMVPRVLAGWLVGLIFNALYKNGMLKKLSYIVASLSAALLNTILFMSTLILLFGKTDYIKGMQGDNNVLVFVIVTVGLNCLVEAILTTILGSVISRSLISFRQE